MTVQSIREHINLIEQAESFHQVLTEGKIKELYGNAKQILRVALDLPGFKKEYQTVSQNKQLVRSLVRQILSSDRSPESIEKILKGNNSLSEDENIDRDIGEKESRIKVWGWFEIIVSSITMYVTFFGDEPSSWNERFQEMIPLLLLATLGRALLNWLYKKNMLKKYNYYKKAADIESDPKEKQKMLDIAKKYLKAANPNEPVQPMEESSVDAIQKIKDLTRDR